jgi:hypothetical protein
MVRLLQWGHARPEAATGQSEARRRSFDAGVALLLVGGITAAAVVGLPPLLTVGGGTGAAVLFVGARAWIAVAEQAPA